MSSEGKFLARQDRGLRLLNAMDACAEDGGGVAEMISSLLEIMGYDGLVNPDGECGCEIGDLLPCTCNENLHGCRPAFKFDCYRCNGWSENGGDCDVCNCEWDTIFTRDAEHCKPDYFKEAI